MQKNEVPSAPSRPARRLAERVALAARNAALTAPFVAAGAFAQTGASTGAPSGIDYGSFVGGGRAELNASFISGGPALFALAGTVAAMGYMLRKVFGIG